VSRVRSREGKGPARNRPEDPPGGTKGECGAPKVGLRCVLSRLTKVASIMLYSPSLLAGVAIFLGGISQAAVTRAAPRAQTLRFAARGAGQVSFAMPSQRREPSLPQPREETAAAALKAKLYVIAGFDAAGRDTNTVYVFDGRKWSTGPSLPTAVDHPAAAVGAGRLYVVGGFGASGASSQTFVLSPSGRSWSTAGMMHRARGALALVALGNQLYALGGKDAAGAEIAPAEVYQISSRSWTELIDLPHPRDHLAGFSYRGWACAAGGRSPNTARVDCYDPGHHAWHRLPDLPMPTSGAGAASYGGVVMVGGGELAAEGGGIIAQLALLSNGKWEMGTMLVPRHGIEFAPYKGRIWACGGGIAPGLHPVAACTSIRP